MRNRTGLALRAVARSFRLNPQPVREGQVFGAGLTAAVTGAQTVNSPNRADMTAATAPAFYEYFPPYHNDCSCGVSDGTRCCIRVWARPRLRYAGAGLYSAAEKKRPPRARAE
jgi:hypothetical protein